MRKIYVTEQQLDEILDANLMISSDPIPEYDDGEVSVTEPDGGDEKRLGKATTTDDKAKAMSPGLYQRLVTRGVYGGPLI